MAVKFRDTYVDDRARALPLEDVYRHFAAFAGIHKTEFNSLVDDSTFDAGWSESSGTWTPVEGGISGTGNGGSIYNALLWDSNTPANYVVDLDMPPGVSHFALLFRARDLENGYIVDTWEDGAAFKLMQNGAATVLSTAPPLPGDMTISGPGRLRLSVRETTFSGHDYDRWLFMSLWVDDYLVLSACHNLEQGSPGYRMGLAVGQGKTTKVARVRIPDMTDLIPYATLDPNETPMSAIQRATLERVIRSAMRWNGALKAWRPAPQAVAQQFSDSEKFSFTPEIDTRELFTRIRLYYGLSWVDRFDDALIAQYGHRYREFTSAFIETENDAYHEAGDMLLRAKEMAFRSTLETNRGLLLEPEDRVEMPDGDSYFIDSIGMRWQRSRLAVTLQGRKYAYPE